MFQQISFAASVVIVLAGAALALSWAYYLYKDIAQPIADSADDEASKLTSDIRRDSLQALAKKIRNGAFYLFWEQGTAGLWIAAGIVVWLALASSVYTAIAFGWGVAVSAGCGYFSLVVATSVTARTSAKAAKNIDQSYKIALKACCVIGFTVVAINLLAVLVLLLTLYVLQGCELEHYSVDKRACLRRLFHSMVGYALGGGFSALIGKVSGCIFAKAADSAADDGRIQKELPAGSPRNPATVADYVGGMVADLSGMCMDLCSSFSGVMCAALLLSSSHLSTSTGEADLSLQSFALVVPALGLIGSVLASYSQFVLVRVYSKRDVESGLGSIVFVAGIISTGLIWIGGYLTHERTVHFAEGRTTGYNTPFLCVCAGLWSSLVYLWAAEYSSATSNLPVQELLNACRSGPATNIIYGLALGQRSTFLPTFVLALTSFYSLQSLGYYGLALSVLGLLSTLPLRIAVDGFIPVARNAAGLADLAGMGDHPRIRLQALILTHALTPPRVQAVVVGGVASLSLYGAFLADQPKSLQIYQDGVFAGLLLGAMLPYMFSAMLVRTSAQATKGVTTEARDQIRRETGIL
ncbi:uncharacterized protein LOC127595136 [Hippocampus zosterae]|uniref:uncharacterized protein LOC127595136 n=1 Tax=Hippocampus zosterae TaxID=109293 RepID=UPI00223D0D5A|nr:uncharacterized protein LOC127595136 [Hippocampus zosterae]